MAVAVGIELDPAALRGVVLEQSGSKIRLLAAHEVACETSETEALSRALNDAKRTLRISSPVVLGVPSTSAILTTVHPLVVTPQRAALAVQFELQQQLPFDLTDAMWHYRWLSSANGRSGFPGPPSTRAGAGRAPRPAEHESRGGQGSGLSPQHSSSAVAVAIRRSVLQGRLDCCQRAGITVQAVVVNPVAALNVCDVKRAPGTSAASGPPVMTVLRLLDQRSAEWILSAPGQLRIVPVAGNSPEVFWQELAASWKALSTQETAVPSPIRIIGPPDIMPRAQEMLAGERVERFDLAQVVALGAIERPDRFVAALGLALQGLGAAGLSLNLLATSQSQAHARRIQRAASLASALCVMSAAVLGLSGMLEVRQRSVRVLRSLERQERLYQTLRPEARALLQQEEHLERRSLQLEHLAGEAALTTQVLARIAEALPGEAWLTSLECSKAGLMSGLIDGRARSFQDVTKFMEQLKSLAGMTTVKPLSTSVTTDGATGTEVIAFSVQVQQPLLPSSVGQAPKGSE